jgi:hypothetical protein
MGRRNRAIQVLLAGLLALVTLGAGAASAQVCSKTWTGNAGDGVWGTAGNWTPSGAPGSSDSVCIPANTPPATFHGGSGISSLADAGSLTIGANNTLVVTNAVNDTGGTLKVDGVDPCTGALPAGLEAATIANGGTLKLEHDGLCSSGAVSVVGTLINTGTIAVSGTNGPFSITGAITNEGSLTIGAGLTLALPSTTSLTNAAGTLDIGGALTVEGSYTQGNGAVIAHPILLDDGSSVHFIGNGAASLSVAGNSTVGVSGTIAAHQTLTAQGVDQCLGSQPATLNATGLLVNGGTLDLDHRGACTGGAVTLNAPAGLDNAGALEITGTTGARSIVGQLINGGALTIGPGLQLNATLIQAAGTTMIGAGATLSQSASSVEIVGGELTGAGTIAGSLDNYGGELDLGSAPVLLSVTGEYTQGTNGSLAIYAGGVGSGQHSVLSAGGGVVLGGRVTIVPSPAYAAGAALQDRVAFLVYAGQRVGQLQSIGSNPPLAGGGSFTVSYDDVNRTVDAVVQPAPPAIVLAAPADGHTYKLHQRLHAAYLCTEASAGPGLASCVGSTADHALIPTGKSGSQTFTVTATSLDGLSSTRIVHYAVALPSNRFIVTDVDVRRSGIAKLRVKLPGPGRLVVSEKLQGAGSLTLFTTRINIQSAGTLRFSVGPVGRAKRKLAHIHRRRLRVMLTITYQPTRGRARTLTLRKSLRAPHRPR